MNQLQNKDVKLILILVVCKRKNEGGVDNHLAN